MNNIIQYLNSLRKEFYTGNAIEHSYRPALKSLIESINSQITAVNEPSRSDFGAPDFIFLDSKNKNIIYGYAETKDIYTDLDKIEKSEQLKRYFGYSNLILTNYLEFRFFRNGEKYQSIEIAKKRNKMIDIVEENFSQLEHELKSFLEATPERITNGKRLAEIMGGKAARIRDNIVNYLKNNNERNQELDKIYKVMKNLLVHDLETSKFADMYAQTLVYGLFVARYYDETPDNFSRQEARDLVPASNPFLRHFFDHIIGPNFDVRLAYIVDELCAVFTVSDVHMIVQKHYNLFGESIDKDPIIHFYEDFLKEYDPLLRKQMGAYYTPVPVVKFILQAVDDVLIKEFDQEQGIASTNKIDHQILVQGKKAIRHIHKVQILDPAVGTATFLNEAILSIFSKFKNQQGLWESYVENELLPRVHGFELMMAPYTIAHLKLAMTLKETGIQQFEKRLGVYLTNSLEEGVKIGDDLFSFGLAEVISEEAKSASVIKHETPIMVVIGNPPYSGESFNKGKYAMKLVDEYKYEPDSKEKLKERNPKWINNDYVKFIALAEKMINKTGEGIMALITDHGYLDNPTFRGVRWHLVKSFSSIYILDLHGSMMRKETLISGKEDQNIFNIKQGVSIIIAIKHKDKKRSLANVYRADVWGRRKDKFEYLLNNTIYKINWENIRLNKPQFLFVNRDEKYYSEYSKAIALNELFPVNVVGYQTHRDKFVVAFNKEDLNKRLDDFTNIELSDSELLNRYSINTSKTWNLSTKRNELLKNNHVEDYITESIYRPFDKRYVCLHPSVSDRSRPEIIHNVLNRENFCLISSKQQATLGYRHCFIANTPPNDCVISTTSKEANQVFPLYIYSNDNQQGFINVPQRSPNLNLQLVDRLLSKIGKYNWINDHKQKVEGEKDSVSPLDVLDYAYATLHSPNYREKYKESLKSNFPRIPLAKDRKSFWKLVELGSTLRQIHLLKHSKLSNFSSSYPVSGNNLIEKISYENEKVFINKDQYFGNIQKEVWELYIGGYQPAQLWLKYRMGRKIDFDDIIHFQKLIKAQQLTIDLMKQID